MLLPIEFSASVAGSGHSTVFLSLHLQFREVIMNILVKFIHNQIKQVVRTYKGGVCIF